MQTNKGYKLKFNTNKFRENTHTLPCFVYVVVSMVFINASKIVFQANGVFFVYNY